MTAPAVTEQVRNGNLVGERVELGRYATNTGERVVYGQRINGVVRIVDCPADGHGRTYLVERELEQDGYSALKALVADYLLQARRLDAVPMATSALGELIREREPAASGGEQ
jgi:hypothetical protein